MSQRSRDMGASVPEAPVTASLRLATNKAGGVELEVHAKPRAKRSAVRGVVAGALEVALAAPPVDGAANDELIRFLATVLAVPRRDVRLVRGDAARHKRVVVDGLDEATVRARLTSAAQ